jgi:hypothetical protein
VLVIAGFGSPGNFGDVGGFGGFSGFGGLVTAVGSSSTAAVGVGVSTGVGVGIGRADAGLAFVRSVAGPVSGIDVTGPIGVTRPIDIAVVEPAIVALVGGV